MASHLPPFLVNHSLPSHPSHVSVSGALYYLLKMFLVTLLKNLSCPLQVYECGANLLRDRWSTTTLPISLVMSSAPLGEASPGQGLVDLSASPNAQVTLAATFLQ